MRTAATARDVGARHGRPVVLRVDAAAMRGAFPDLAGYLATLGAFSRVRLVQVRAQPATCLERIRARDAAQHIPVSDAQIGLINARSLALDLPYELVITNDPPAPPAQIVAAITGLLSALPRPRHWSVG